MHPKQTYLLEAKGRTIKEVADFVFNAVFRTDFSKPGFAVIDFGDQLSPVMLRSNMTDLKLHLGMKTSALFGQVLNYQWLGSFNQQETTKFHLDNAADQSFLMLGYEPSIIKSRLYVADYMQFIHAQKITESEFFDKYNPIYSSAENYIAPYITEIEAFNNNTSQIVMINNSNSRKNGGTIGLLHKAEIINKNKSESRIVNSMMLCFADFLSDDKLAEQQVEFIVNGKIPG